MINFFNILNGKVVIDADSLSIPPFKEYWESFDDKSIPDKEIRFCVFMHKWDSPYKAYDKFERKSVIMKHVFKNENYKFSSKYKQFEEEFLKFLHTPATRLLDAAENGIEFLIREYNRLFDNDGVDAGDVEGWLMKLGPAIKSYEQLKEQVRTEEQVNKMAKGNTTIGYFEVPRGR